MPPERPELHISIDPDGAVTAYRAQRWRDRKSGYVPFGADVDAERTFSRLLWAAGLPVGIDAQMPTCDLAEGHRRVSW
ncbi:MAG TPA: hypothetical protein VFZ00_24240 [Solirubrobacter sp.]|nr:hypothetical protein [Solirubrobacter sp.]